MMFLEELVGSKFEQMNNRLDADTMVDEIINGGTRYAGYGVEVCLEEEHGEPVDAPLRLLARSDAAL